MSANYDNFVTNGKDDNEMKKSLKSVISGFFYVGFVEKSSI